MKENYKNDHPLLLNMDEKLKDQLFEVAGREYSSASQIARKAIRKYIKEEKEKNES